MSRPRSYDLRRTRRGALPLRLARIHQALAADDPVDLWLPTRPPGSELLARAGFAPLPTSASPRRPRVRVRARRLHTLPDYVRPGLRLLVCGLNPSPFAATSGVPFGRPGNRFWPAARAAGIVSTPCDPFAAARDGVGFTDLCKRTTRRAATLRASEFRRGVADLEGLVERWRPAAVCLVGLEGWRRAVDARARPGIVEGGLAGRPAYLMPSTSGLNAHETAASLARHLTRALRLTRR